MQLQGHNNTMLPGQSFNKYQQLKEVAEQFYREGQRYLWFRLSPKTYRYIEGNFQVTDYYNNGWQLENSRSWSMSEEINGVGAYEFIDKIIRKK